MCVFARGIKLPLDVSVQRSQHADARMHQRPATKQVGDHGKDEVTVIFQHWIKARTLDALIADWQAESGRAQS
jgi:hypothetical protein